MSAMTHSLIGAIIMLISVLAFVLWSTTWFGGGE